MGKTLQKKFEIRIRKDALKFASSHMTVFADGSKEHLHGHHYQPTVSVTFQDASLKKMIPFVEIKNGMKKIASLWDEKVLLASENPFFKVKKQSRDSLSFILCNKEYLLPRDEVVLLKTDNITCETLARAYYEFMEMELDLFRNPNVLSMSVYIEESPGQGAAYVVSRG
jgi:6-pyruvoyltetrahydropterin/6-carboxytetrahydropterin synthase